MAVSDFGVTTADVTDALPFDASQITDASKVTTSQISGWIDDASGLLAGAIGKAGLSAAVLGDDALAQAREAIVAYAVSRALDRLGYARKLRDDARGRWERALRTYADRPQVLATRPTARASSNVDTTSPTTRTFGSDYQW